MRIHTNISFHISFSVWLLLLILSKAQEVLFDFDNAPLHSPLPIYQTSGGITAHLSATGQGYSIQYASALGFTPPGFAGLMLYPNSINLSDLASTMTTHLPSFRLCMACQELGCDDAAHDAGDSLLWMAAMLELTLGKNSGPFRAHGRWIR